MPGGAGEGLFSGARRVVAYLTPCNPPCAPLGFAPPGLVGEHGFGPAGSYGRVGSEGLDGPRSVSKPRPRASAGLDLPLRSWAVGPGLGCCGAGERGEARTCVAGTRALAHEQRGATPRIPRIPARPRFCRHVVAPRAAFTVRLGEGAHSRLRRACGPPRTRSADAGSRHSAWAVHAGRTNGLSLTKCPRSTFFT